MFDRFRLGTVLLLGLALPFIGCGSSEVSSISVSPAAVNFGGIGLTAQLTATGTYGNASHTQSTKNITDEVTWTTSSAEVATVSPTGLVTSTGQGVIQVTASINSFSGIVSSNSTITVTLPTGTGGGTSEPVTKLSIIPGASSVASPSQTSQFIAIGTTGSGATENLTSQVTWSSSTASVGTIGLKTGLATAVGQGTTTITAIWTNPDTTIVTATATFTVVGGTSEPLTALSITPTAESLSALGQTGQLIALGTSGTTGLEQNVTTSSQLSWTSSIPSIAKVSSSGLVTGVSAGNTTISALWTNPDGSVVSASVAVTITTTTAPEPLLSLTIIPTSISVGNLEDTGNFLAIGTFSTVPYVRDLTNTVAWISDAPNIFPVSTNSDPVNPGAPGGVVTAYGNGTGVIIAEATSSDGTIQTATTTFSCPLVLPNPNGNPPTAGSCYPGSQAASLLATITVYNQGLNTTNWLVTAPSATNTPDVLHCGPGWTGSGGSVCTATYPLGTTITLTAPAEAGVAFGGWSYNCTPVVPINAAGPNSCTITLGNVAPTGTPDVNTGNSNVTVGAIFN
jgi:uncharacterized protein YjdB